MRKNMIKRMIAVLLTGALIFSAAACGKKQESDAESTQSAPPVTELESHGEGLPEQDSGTETEGDMSSPAAEEPESSAEAAPEAVPEESGPVKGTVVEEDFYTVTIPEKIEDKVTVHTGYGQEVAIYDKESMEAGQSGFVVSIGTYLHAADFIMLPSYEYLGRLFAEGVEFYVAAYYPTEVQTDAEHEAVYQEIAEQTKTILASLTAKEGTTFTPGTIDDIAYEIRRYEYTNAILNAYQAGYLPDGTVAETFDPAVMTGRYAIQDINGDGAEDLLLSLNAGYSYTYDPEKAVYIKLDTDPMLLSSVMWMEMTDANVDSMFATLYGA